MTTKLSGGKRVHLWVAGGREYPIYRHREGLFAHVVLDSEISEWPEHANLAPIRRVRDKPDTLAVGWRPYVSLHEIISDAEEHGYPEVEYCCALVARVAEALAALHAVDLDIADLSASDVWVTTTKVRVCAARATPQAPATASAQKTSTIEHRGLSQLLMQLLCGRDAVGFPSDYRRDVNPDLDELVHSLTANDGSISAATVVNRLRAMGEVPDSWLSERCNEQLRELRQQLQTSRQTPTAALALAAFIALSITAALTALWVAWQG